MKSIPLASTCWRVRGCGGRLRLVALIEEAAVIQRILRHLGLPTEIPEPSPARAPPVRAPDPLWEDADVHVEPRA